MRSWRRWHKESARGTAGTNLTGGAGRIRCCMCCVGLRTGPKNNACARKRNSGIETKPEGATDEQRAPGAAAAAPGGTESPPTVSMDDTVVLRGEGALEQVVGMTWRTRRCSLRGHGDRFGSSSCDDFFTKNRNELSQPIASRRPAAVNDAVGPASHHIAGVISLTGGPRAGTDLTGGVGRRVSYITCHGTVLTVGVGPMSHI